jgi:hypothetical protein
MNQLERGLVNVIAATLVSTTASAQVAAPKTSIMGLVEDGNRFVQAAIVGDPTPPRATGASAETTETATDPKPLFDFAPRASVVARDWRGSLRVAGRTTVLDDLRPSASNRMVLLRLESDARFAPFAQVGAGEWRIDPVLFPSMPAHEAIAGQIGAGFELKTLRGVVIGGETQYTILYREGPHDGDDVAPHIFAFIFAAKTAW